MSKRFCLFFKKIKLAHLFQFLDWYSLTEMNGKVLIENW